MREAVLRMATAVAKEGPDTPGFAVGDEGFQKDTSLALIADESESFIVWNSGFG